jgi:hypothetical protein
MFSLVSALPSIDSANRESAGRDAKGRDKASPGEDANGLRSLFIDFLGTMELSDSPATYMSAVRRYACADRSRPWKPGCRRGLSASARKASSRACGLRLREGGAGLASDVRLRCCLPPVKTRSALLSQ